MRAEQGKQHSAAWVASTTPGPSRTEGQSSVNTAGGGLQLLCMCREPQDLALQHTGHVYQRHTRAACRTHHTPRAVISSAPSPAAQIKTRQPLGFQLRLETLAGHREREEWGMGSSHPAAQRPSVQEALGDQSWCSRAVSKHTVDSVGYLCSWAAMSHSAALLTPGSGFGPQSLLP